MCYTYIHTYMNICSLSFKIDVILHVHCTCGFKSHLRHFGKVCCVALPCCLFDLACFFLPSISLTCISVVGYLCAFLQFEKQVYDIVGSSWRLRNTDQVISISRIMLQAESVGQRVMLLQVLQVYTFRSSHMTCM